ncbi:KRAB-A domain-containing protein 2-like [Acyrthosiphon pisum]|uniref:Integrase catalytic domain-containing protein n=1 Tax=Acyrthosiphon pisum TaxID=7029 RepID=A0A8R2BB59_ACYPI|nr:KRAB-A domain-containing protein 2-like [Acyrthosiphon pisum]|eukprot:XP_008189468.1 PREDICTED: KRAB-A domain-containing protein 2-like [Acyrthosiphon pisum]
MTIAGKEKSIKPISDGTVLYYLKVDEMFDVLYTTHIAIGHGGRDRMLLFILSKKQPNPKKGLVSKPIVHTAFNSRAQIDLINMQSQCYNDYRFILNYQDHLTKFVLLRPLKTKRAEEIAINLLDIYTTFGAPSILHSDNGREFVNSIITNLNEMWSDVKIVHGKPRHIQSQGSVERANRDIEAILAA